MKTLLLLLVTSLSTALAADKPAMIENELLKVTLTPDGKFQIADKATGRVVAADGDWPAGRGVSQGQMYTHPVFGNGHAILTHDGAVMMFPKLPFVLFRNSIRNDTKDTKILNQVPVLSFGTKIGKELTTMGTGGLQTPEKNTGSYAWLAIADPQTRNGIVTAWLTHDRGSGVVFSPVTNDQVRVEAQIDYGRLRIKRGASAETETLAIGYFADARLGLEAWADALAKVYTIKLPHQPAGYCTWYADKYAGACDEQHLPELAAFAAKELKPFGFEFVQIDDHWQAGVSKNGPKREFMRAKPDGPYPSGMKATADNITKLSLTPGIWFMPFAGTSYDPFFEPHQDWFYKDKDGKPFEVRWGGTCLDMTVPGARDYLKELVHRLAHEWGYKVFKMDGLWTGTGTRLMYVNNGYKWDEMGEAVPADPDKTQIEAYRDGLKLVRQIAGRDVFLLGCCVSQNMRSFGGAFGLLDAMRIGPDTGAGHIGAPHASRNYFLNGRVWWNDPDCVSVRAKTPLDQARVNASFTAITGDLFYNSDWMPDLPAERLDILKRTMPAHGLPARPVDYFENDPARIWVLPDSGTGVSPVITDPIAKPTGGTPVPLRPRRDIIGLFNWDQKNPVKITCTTDRLGLPAATEYVAFDFWANRFVAPFRSQLSMTLPPAYCRVLAVRPVADHPQLLSTSRHVTQGIVDVLEEKWDATTKTLAGVSRVVGNDPYELRIIVPVGEKSWRAAEPATVQQDGPRVRVALTNSTSGEVKWQVKFEPARVELAPPSPVAGLQATAEYGVVMLNWTDSGADRYRVTRDDGAAFETMAAGYTDTTVSHGKNYRYNVAALGWGDVASTPATITVATPAELKRPPTPPAPDVNLVDLKPVAASNGWGKLGINQSIEGKPLTIDGKRYDKGLGAHANGLLVYEIPAGMRRFVAVAGLDDEKRDDERTSVTLEVYGDVKEMGEAPVLLAKSPVLSSKTIRSWAFNVELTSRFKQLRLVVTDAADGIASDHADWVDAGFRKE